MTKKDKSNPIYAFPLIKLALTLTFSLIITFTLVAASCGKGKDADNGESSSSKGIGKGGTLTITGIPEEYNGMYVQFITVFAGFWGAKTVDKDSPDYGKLPQISKGSISIPLWQWKNADQTEKQRYSGNANAAFYIMIWDSDIINAGKGYCQIKFESVLFKNGSAKVAWEDGQIVEKYVTTVSFAKNGA